MNPRRAVVAGAVLACLPLWSVAAEPALKLRLLAEPFPPLQYTDPGGVTRGVAVELLKTALERVADDFAIEPAALEFVPLRRALQVAATQPNVIVLSVARTPEREAEFHWLGTVSPYELWIYRHKRHAVPELHEPAQLLGRGLRFGAQAGSNFEAWLLRQGIAAPGDNSTIDTVPQNQLNFAKAQLGRIDLFAHPEISFAYRAAEHGLRADDFEKVLRIDALSTPLWAVIHPRSDPTLVARLEQQLQRLHQSGQAERMRQQSLKTFGALYKLDAR